jgi:hypothetical protein
LVVLLNLVRVLIALAALLLVETIRRAWLVEGFPLLLVFSAGMFIAFCAGDIAEEWLVARFNRDSEQNETSEA